VFGLAGLALSVLALGTGECRSGVGGWRGSLVVPGHHWAPGSAPGPSRVWSGVPRPLSAPPVVRFGLGGCALGVVYARRVGTVVGGGLRGGVGGRVQGCRLGRWWGAGGGRGGGCGGQGGRAGGKQVRGGRSRAQWFTTVGVWSRSRQRGSNCSGGPGWSGPGVVVFSDASVPACLTARGAVGGRGVPGGRGWCGGRRGEGVCAFFVGLPLGGGGVGGVSAVCMGDGRGGEPR